MISKEKGERKGAGLSRTACVCMVVWIVLLYGVVVV